MKESENTYTTLAELRKNYTEQLDKYYALLQKYEKLQEEFVLMKLKIKCHSMSLLV